MEKEEIVYNRNLVPQPHSPSFLSDALCYNACEIAKDVNANALIGMTQSGYTGFMLSSYRPRSPLYVFTKTQTLVNQLSLSWGVQAFYYDKEESLDDIIADQIRYPERQRTAQNRRCGGEYRQHSRAGTPAYQYAEDHQGGIALLLNFFLSSSPSA